MTSAERVGLALSHREPDRVPVLLTVNLHGSVELGLDLETYFSRADHVVQGQLRLRRRFGHDALLGFLYAAVEHEAFGGGVLFAANGPPNAGAPFAGGRDRVLALEVPDIAAHPRLQMVLEVIERLAASAAGEVPVLGTVIGPASLPVMLLGFEPYLVLLHEEPETIEHLLDVTTRFCVAWGRAQLRAGASALALFDPFSSPTVTDDPLYERFVGPATRAALASLGGPVVLHLASGRVGQRLPALSTCGAIGLGVRAADDLSELEQVCAGRQVLVGNLNGVTMARWTPREAREAATRAIRAAGPGGGFLLSDNHGEIPLQVSSDVLHAIMDTAREVGRYPIEPHTDA